MEAKITDLNTFIEDYNNLTPWDKEKFFNIVVEDIPTRKFEEYDFDLGDIFYCVDPYGFIDYYGMGNILSEIGHDYIEQYLDNNYGEYNDKDK